MRGGRRPMMKFHVSHPRKRHAAATAAARIQNGAAERERLMFGRCVLMANAQKIPRSQALPGTAPPLRLRLPNSAWPSPGPRGRASHAARFQAEPGNENQTVFTSVVPASLAFTARYARRRNFGLAYTFKAIKCVVP